MGRQRISVLGAHLRAGLEHPLIHLPVFPHASVELEGSHAGFRDDVLHHALLGVYIDVRLWEDFFWLFYFDCF